MAKPNTPAPAAPVVAPAAAPVEEKKKAVKIPKAIADALLASGTMKKEEYDRLTKAGAITSGEGGGEDIYDQLKSGGVSEALITSFKKALEAVVNVLWRDSKTYIGTKMNYKFTFTHDGVDYSYEAPAEIELAAWVKHFDPKQKENREAALAKAGIVVKKS